MKIIKADTVKIISGKDRGKTGEVLAVFPKNNKILVKGVNIVTKHRKKGGEKKSAGITKFELPIDISNVQVLDPKSGRPARVGFELNNGKKIRIFKTGKISSKQKKVETTNKPISKKKEEGKEEKKEPKKLKNTNKIEK